MSYPTLPLNLALAAAYPLGHLLADAAWVIDATLGRDLADFVTFTGDGNRTYFDKAGVLRVADVDRCPVDYDPVTGEPGWPYWESRTNYVKNSSMATAVLGVIGSGGALPTGWVMSNPVGDPITKTVVGFGTLPNGMPYIDFRWQGTNTTGATAYRDIYLTNHNECTAAVGSVGSASAYAQLLSGTPPRAIQLNISEVNSAGSYLTAVQSLAVSPTFQALSVTRTAANASVAAFRAYFGLSLLAGESIDVTIRVAVPQLERGGVSPWIPTGSTAVTRAAPSAALAGGAFSAIWNPAGGTLFTEASQPILVGASRTAMGISNGGGTNRFSHYVNSAGAINLYTNPAPSTIVTGPNAVAGALWRRATSFAAGTCSTAANGGGVVARAHTMDLAAMNVLTLGNAYPGAAEHWNGRIKRAAYWRTPLPDLRLRNLGVA